VYPIPDWPTDVPWAHGLSGTGMQAAATVAEQLGSYCLLVIRHGVLVAEHYWQGRSATSIDKSWSMGKSYASALVGIAIDRGEIKSLDDSVSDYVPEWKGTDHEPITIRHIVSMTSGLKWEVFSDYVTMATLTADQSKYAVGLPISDPPGTKWIYHNGGVQILERVIRAATGKTLEAYADLYLWSKIGMTATWAKDQTGNPTAYANVLATCRDHARFGYLYLHGGEWAGETVVSPQWVTATIAPGQTMNRAYGYLWWLNGETPAIDAMNQAWPGRMVPFAPTDMFAVRGFGNQFIDVIPSLDMIVVRMGPDPFGGMFDLNQMIKDQHFGEHDQILKPILDAVVP
jgi:CubicO group peptidase (beta-lactamase class C family)